MTRRILSLGGLGIAALITQSAAAAVLPACFVPDFALLLAVAMAVSAPALEGLIVATGVGYGADLLSGSLLGHHALLRLIAFVVTRTVGAQFHLRSGLSLAVFTAAITVLDAAGTAGLGWLFSGDSLVSVRSLEELAVRAGANALFVPFVHAAVVGVLELLVERESRRRDVRLDTRRPVL